MENGDANGKKERGQREGRRRDEIESQTQ